MPRYDGVNRFDFISGHFFTKFSMGSNILVEGKMVFFKKFVVSPFSSQLESPVFVLAMPNLLPSCISHYVKRICFTKFGNVAFLWINEMKVLENLRL